MLDRVCENCGKPYRCYPRDVRRGKVFCSRACAGALKTKRTLPLRFESKVEYEPMSGCWLWSGATAEDYGYIGTGGHTISKAHRVSYELHIGPIPEGLNVLHRCDVRPCVNPAHLFLGTQKDNVADMIAKGRNVALRGESSPVSKLSKREVLLIRHLSRCGLKTPHISTIRKVKVPTVQGIVYRRNWRHLP